MKFPAEETLQRVWNGELEAVTDVLFEQYDRLSSKIQSQIPPQFQSAIASEDVLQDVFIAVFKSIDSLVPCSPAAFIGWLDSIAKHQTIDSLRHLNAKKRGGGVQKVTIANQLTGGSVVQLVGLLIGNELSPSINVARDEASNALNLAILDLAADQKQAIELRCVEGLSMEEVADIMNRSEDAVRNLIYRAKANLRIKMRESGMWLEKK